MLKIFLLLYSLSLFATDIQKRALIIDDYPSTAGEANSILLNVELQGSLETTGDIDWFKFTIETLDGIEFIWKTNEGTVNSHQMVNFDVMSEAEAFQTYPNLIVDGFFKSNTTTPSESALVNLNPGVYYIKVYTYDDDLSGYTIQVNSEYNNGTGWIPDSQTVIYCKEHLEECGIKPKIIALPL